MHSKREFDIAFVGLKPGIHEFSYKIEDKFFDAFDEQDFSECHAEIKLSIDKNNSFMLLRFEIGGNLKVVCDRCGSTIPLDLWDEFMVTVKMVDEPDLMNMQEEDPDVNYISRGESILNVQKWIYEFINLSIPMHKTCGYDNQGKSLCNEEALRMLNKLDVEKNSPKKGNSLWKGLDQFRDLDE